MGAKPETKPECFRPALGQKPAENRRKEKAKIPGVLVFFLANSPLRKKFQLLVRKRNGTKAKDPRPRGRLLSPK